MTALLISLAPFLMGLGAGVAWALLRVRGLRLEYDADMLRQEKVILLLSEALIEGKPARMEGPVPTLVRVCPCGCGAVLNPRWLDVFERRYS